MLTPNKIIPTDEQLTELRACDTWDKFANTMRDMFGINFNLAARTLNQKGYEEYDQNDIDIYMDILIGYGRRERNLEFKRKVKEVENIFKDVLHADKK